MESYFTNPLDLAKRSMEKSLTNQDLQESVATLGEKIDGLKKTVNLIAINDSDRLTRRDLDSLHKELKRLESLAKKNPEYFNSVNKTIEKIDNKLSEAQDSIDSIDSIKSNSKPSRFSPNQKVQKAQKAQETQKSKDRVFQDKVSKDKTTETDRVSKDRVSKDKTTETDRVSKDRVSKDRITKKDLNDIIRTRDLDELKRTLSRVEDLIEENNRKSQGNSKSKVQSPKDTRTTRGNENSKSQVSNFDNNLGSKFEKTMKDSTDSIVEASNKTSETINTHFKTLNNNFSELKTSIDNLNRESSGSQGPQDLQAPLDSQGSQDSQNSQDSQSPLDSQSLQTPQVLQVPQAPQVLQVFQDSPNPQESQESQESQVSQSSQDSQESQELSDLRPISIPELVIDDSIIKNLSSKESIIPEVRNAQESKSQPEMDIKESVPTDFQASVLLGLTSLKDKIDSHFSTFEDFYDKSNQYQKKTLNEFTDRRSNFFKNLSDILDDINSSGSNSGNSILDDLPLGDIGSKKSKKGSRTKGAKSPKSSKSPRFRGKLGTRLKVGGGLLALASTAFLTKEYLDAKNDEERTDIAYEGGGGILGGALGGAAVGFAGGGPVGSLLGGIAGGFLGSSAGRAIRENIRSPLELIPDNIKHQGSIAELQFIDQYLLPQIQSDILVDGKNSRWDKGDIKTILEYRRNVLLRNVQKELKSNQNLKIDSKDITESEKFDLVKSYYSQTKLDNPNLYLDILQSLPTDVYPKELVQSEISDVKKDPRVKDRTDLYKSVQSSTTRTAELFKDLNKLYPDPSMDLMVKTSSGDTESLNPNNPDDSANPISSANPIDFNEVNKRSLENMVQNYKPSSGSDISNLRASNNPNKSEASKNESGGEGLSSNSEINPMSESAKFADTTSSKAGSKTVSRVLGTMVKNSRGASYSQENRCGPNSFDCSSFVGRSLKESGFKVNPNMTTTTMIPELTRVGFKYYQGNPQVNQLRPGDILLDLKPGHRHTETYIGNGQLIGAHGKHTSAPTEVGVRKYYSSPWSGVFRYGGPEISPSNIETSGSDDSILDNSILDNSILSDIGNSLKDFGGSAASDIFDQFSKMLGLDGIDSSDSGDSPNDISSYSDLNLDPTSKVLYEDMGAVNPVLETAKKVDINSLNQDPSVAAEIIRSSEQEGRKRDAIANAYDEGRILRTELVPRGSNNLDNSVNSVNSNSSDNSNNSTEEVDPYKLAGINLQTTDGRLIDPVINDRGPFISSANSSNSANSVNPKPEDLNNKIEVSQGSDSSMELSNLDNQSMTFNDLVKAREDYSNSLEDELSSVGITRSQGPRKSGSFGNNQNSQSNLNSINNQGNQTSNNSIAQTVGTVGAVNNVAPTIINNSAPPNYTRNSDDSTLLYARYC